MSKQSEANARLIAELLEALRTTSGNIRSLLGPAGAPGVVFEPYRVWLRVVDEAIAKAEGEAYPVTDRDLPGAL